MLACIFWNEVDTFPFFFASAQEVENDLLPLQLGGQADACV